MSFEDMLKTLHLEYLGSIPEKAANLEDLIRAGDVVSVRDAFHKLKGTGKTYGLPEVSDLAEVVEAVCVQRPVNALTAAGLAVAILRDIHQARTAAQSKESTDSTPSYVFDQDARFQHVQKLLHN